MARVADSWTYSAPGAPGSNNYGPPVPTSRSMVRQPIVGSAPTPQSMQRPQPYQAPQTSYPSNNYSPPAATAAPAPAAMPPMAAGPPSIDQYLRGDTTLIGQEAALRNSLSNYNTSYNQQNANYKTDYNLNKSNLALAKVEADRGMNDDYAGRGMINSGLYAKAYADQMAEYNGRQSAMDNAQTTFLNSQTQNKNNFDTQENLSSQKAREDAINRRALQYNITA